MNRPLTSWILPLFGAALMALPSTAGAITGEQVDPKAPCFRWPAVDYDGDGVFDRLDNCPDTPKGCTVDRYGCTTDGDGDGVCDGLDECPDTPANAVVDDQGCSDSDRPGRAAAHSTHSEPPAAAPVPTSKSVSDVERKLIEHGRIRLENLYFESGSANLLPESEASLREVGEALQKFTELKIEIQGHTDTRGRAAYNQRLSQQRAESVRAYLLSHFHLDPDNIVARGYGETEPETRERNDEELFRNRRVELKALNPEVLPKTVKVVEQK